MSSITTNHHVLDASGKKVGRVASAAAKLLMGKQTTTFTRHQSAGISVEIVNAGKADISSRKKAEELKASFSGFPSGITTPTVGYILQKKGARELFRRAVAGMLPKNKLQKTMLKNLKISE